MFLRGLPTLAFVRLGAAREGFGSPQRRALSWGRVIHRIYGELVGWDPPLEKAQK